MVFFQQIESNGYDHEGIGSVFNYQLMGYGISKSLGMEYYFDEFENIGGWQMTNEDKITWDNNFNNFFNFDKYTLKGNKNKEYKVFSDYRRVGNFPFIKLKRKILFKLFKLQLNKIEKTNILKNLKNNIKYDGPNYLDDDYINISIHIRTTQKFDQVFESHRDFFYGLNQQIDYYNLVIRQIEHRFQNDKLKFHIFSTGNKENFKDIKNFLPHNETLLHLDDNPLVPIYHFINSEVFFMSNSEMSHICHFLNNGLNLVPGHVLYRNYYKNSVKVNKDGFIENINSLSL